MSRHSRIILPSAQPMYAAALRWRDEAFVGDRSLFDGRALDTRRAAEELLEHVVRQPDVGAGTFVSKLRGQLEGVSEDAVQVAAELIYAHCLIASTEALSPRTKAQYVDNVVAFRSNGTTPIPDDLRAALNGGVAHPGQAFNNYRWKIFNYLVDVFARFKQLDGSERSRTVADYDTFHAFIQQVDDQTAWSQRYALEHLLFPDDVPPVLSRDHRALIVKSLGGGLGTIRDVVPSLEPNVRYGTAAGVNFYLTPYRERWQGIPAVNDTYVAWAGLMLDSIDLDVIERDYKLESAAGFRQAFAAIDGGADPATALRAPFQATNLVDFRVFDDFLGWAAAEPELARRAVGELRRDPGPDSIDRFLQLIPTERQLSGTGARLSLASCLLFATSPEQLPPWRDTPAKVTMRLADGYPVQDAATAGERYVLFLERLDAILVQLNKAQPRLRDRLDAQSIAWSLAKQTPPQEWSEETRSAFEDWRSGKSSGKPPLPVDPVDLPAPTTDDLAEQLHLDAEGAAWLDETIELLTHKRQIILQGPPGTGKTFIGRALAEFLAGDADRVRLVQFHPGTSYEDFVQGLRPDPERPTEFRVVDGPLIRIAEAARQQPDLTFVLLIDEINRGNVPAVFGELYYLLEYRGRRVTLMYGAEFELPANLLLIGTMNTADRSITSLDAALRRRFYIRDLRPEQAPVSGVLRRYLDAHAPSLGWLADLLDTANTRIGDPDQSIGPSHFMGPGIDETWAARAWDNSVMPTLHELFYNQPARVAELEFEQLKAAVTRDVGDAVE